MLINPYKILNISQDASKDEIIKGKILAMKDKQYSLQAIQAAEKQLLTPSKRVVADILFPSKMRAKRPKVISYSVKPVNVDLSKLDIDAFDSLK